MKRRSGWGVCRTLGLGALGVYLVVACWEFYSIISPEVPIPKPETRNTKREIRNPNPVENALQPGCRVDTRLDTACVSGILQHHHPRGP